MLKNYNKQKNVYLFHRQTNLITTGIESEIQLFSTIKNVKEHLFYTLKKYMFAERYVCFLNFHDTKDLKSDVLTKLSESESDNLVWDFIENVINISFRGEKNDICWLNIWRSLMTADSERITIQITHREINRIYPHSSDMFLTS